MIVFVNRYHLRFLCFDKELLEATIINCSRGSALCSSEQLISQGSPSILLIPVRLMVSIRENQRDLQAQVVFNVVHWLALRVFEQ
jgi:hypothetical protein